MVMSFPLFSPSSPRSGLLPAHRSAIEMRRRHPPPSKTDPSCGPSLVQISSFHSPPRPSSL
jgi:hypothetical protein